MSRDELAEAVALWLAQHDDKSRDVAFDGNHLGKIERGVVGRPRRHYVSALCAVLGATEAELGFACDPEFSLVTVSSSWDRVSIAKAVDRIARDDLAANRRQALATALLAGTALTQPLQRWLEPVAEVAKVADAARTNAFTPPEVGALEVLTDQFRMWSKTGNGALARRAVAAQLFELNERLRDAPSGPLTTRAMLVAAQLAQTAASMSWDAGEHHTPPSSTTS